jgi:hypothetical protein
MRAFQRAGRIQHLQRLGGPPHRRHRVAPRLLVDQLVQRPGQQISVQLLRALAAPARPAGTAHHQRLRIIQLIPSPAHRVRNDPDPA